MDYTDSMISWADPRKVVDKCDELIIFRSRVSDKEDFARLVFQNLFGDGAVDLLSLRPHFDNVHAEALNRLNGLIGFESSVFKTIYTNDLLFDDFIRVFANHAINSRAPPSAVGESIYVWLLLEYLGHILPIDETKLNFMKNSNWLSTPFSSKPISQSASSPRKLLRPEVLAASYPLEHVAVRSASLRSLYPRLVQFLGGLIKHLSSLSAWPSIAQCEVLKLILNHYHEFILLDTDDGEFSSLKFMLIRKPLFTAPLQTFIQRLLANWPLNPSYIELIKLWMTLAYHPYLESRNEEKKKVFLETSTQHFIGCFELIIERILDADCICLFESQVLDFVEQSIFDANSPRFLKLFSKYGMVTVEYLESILSKLVHFRNEQKVLSGTEKSSSLLVKFARFLSNLSNYSNVGIEVAEQHIKTITRILYAIQELNNDSTFIDGGGIGGLSSSTPISAKKFTAADPHKRNWSDLSAITSGGGTSLGIDESLQSTSVFDHHEEGGNAPHHRKNDAVDGALAMPDHDVDPWTKMLFLTPSGRVQVLNRRSHFDFKQCSQQIAETFPHVRRWEIASLVKFFHNLSVRYSNCWLVNYLRMHSHDSVITRKMAHLLLSAPSPPHYVPVFSRTVPLHSRRLNMRIFASIPFLIFVYVVLYVAYVVVSRVFFM